MAPQRTCSDLGRSCQVQVEIKGPEALKLAEYLTLDLSKIVPGQCMYVPLIDEKAGIVNDPIILCLAPDRFWLSSLTPHYCGSTWRLARASMSKSAIQTSSPLN